MQTKNADGVLQGCYGAIQLVLEDSTHDADLVSRALQVCVGFLTLPKLLGMKPVWVPTW